MVVLDGAAAVSGTVGAAAVLGACSAGIVAGGAVVAAPSGTDSISTAVTPSPTPSEPEATTWVQALATRDAPTTEAIRRLRTAQR